MSDSDSKKLGSVDVGLSVAGAKGHVKVDTSEGLVKFVRPELYRSTVAFETTVRGIHLKQDRGEELSPLEQQMLLVSLMPILSGKLQNVAAVIEYAQQIDPSFGTYVNGKAPMSGPPIALPGGSEDGDLDIPITVEEEQKQYWWDRFWTDAEGVSAEYVQRLLAELGVRQSNSEKRVISLRTLDVLRTLEPVAWSIFKRISVYAFADKVLPASSTFEQGYDDVGVGFGDLTEVQEAGLIDLGNIAYMFRDAEIAGHHFMCLETAGSPVKVPGILLTRPGRELLKLITPSPTERQVLAVGHYLQHHVRKGEVLWRPEGGGQYKSLPPREPKT